MEFPRLSETGRKTFFWYRVYCATLTVLYLAVAIFGILITLVPLETKRYEPEELQIMGILYAVLGIVFFIVSAVALFLPPKPYNWVVGLIMIAIGMTSCCLWPAVVPLLIFWLKPETQEFFGRKKAS